MPLTELGGPFFTWMVPASLFQCDTQGGAVQPEAAGVGPGAGPRWSTAADSERSMGGRWRVAEAMVGCVRLFSRWMMDEAELVEGAGGGRCGVLTSAADLRAAGCCG